MERSKVKVGALVWYANDILAEVLEVTPNIKVHTMMDGAIFDTLAHRLYPADGETRAQFVQYDGHWMMNDDGSKRGPRSIEGMLCYVMSNGALRIAEVMEIIGTVAVARIAADGAIRAVPIHELTLKPLAKRDDWPEYIGLWIYNDDGSKVNTSK